MNNTGFNKAAISLFALALVSLAWGTSYAIIKDTLNQATPFMLMTIRFGFSAIFLSLIYIKRFVKISKTDLIKGIKIGIFMFGAFITLVVGIQYTTASKQSFIIGSYVLIVPFLTWLINGRKPTGIDIIGALLAVVGIGLLTLGGIDGINVGDIISIGCAVSFALHMIMIERYCNESDPIILTIVQFWVTSVLFVILTCLFEKPDISIVARATPEIFYLVIVTTVIAFVVQNVAQRYVSSTSTALVLTLESVFGSIFAVYYLGERLSPSMIIGCLTVFIGIVIHETKLDFIKGIKKEKSDNNY